MPQSASEPDEYLLGHSANEEERLRKQPGELASDSRQLLDRLNIRPGDQAIDIGCGPQGIIDLLSERVGANGHVVGLERSEPTVRLARQFIAEHNLRNVEVLQGDAKATGLPRAFFDLVHARLVLVNVPEPQRVVEEMVALARPGGVVASHEADWGAFLCDRRHLPGIGCWRSSWRTLGTTGSTCSSEERHTECSGLRVSSTFKLIQ
jgi:SAM-dependent methyltransferase